MTTQIEDAVKAAKESKKQKGIKARAQGISVQGIIDQVPENSKYNVLASLVSSISCSVIGTANSVVGRFERMENIDFKTLERNEIIHMMLEADMRQDLLRNVRGLVRIRQDLRDQLLAVANDDNLASWPESIAFMTQPAGTSRINKERLFEAFIACGIDDEKTLETMYAATLIEETTDRQRSAEQISSRRGNIEWMIEQIFSSKETINEAGQYIDDEFIVSAIEDLPAEIQDRLYSKVRQSLNKALTRAAARFAVGDTRYEIGDILQINILIKDAKLLEAFVDD